jgi:hypothetical protein
MTKPALTTSHYRKYLIFLYYKSASDKGKYINNSENMLTRYCSLFFVIIYLTLYLHVYNLVDVYHTQIILKTDQILFRENTPSISKKSLGLRIPSLDPNCLESDSIFIIDGENECYGAQLGNYLAALYMSVMRAKQRNNTFAFICGNGSSSIFKKLDFVPPKDFEIFQDIPDLCLTCTTYVHTCDIGLNHAFSLIKSSLQGLDAPEQMDDVTIHFRCGDILSHPFHEYGYPRYRIYDLLGHAFDSVGILSAPFGEKQSRLSDLVNALKCNKLLYDYVDYFASQFPNVKVTVRNNDSLEEAFGRLIHSNQSWCNPSTFCLFPVLATRGHGFILDSDLYPFVRKITSDKITLVQTEMLHTKKMLRKKMTVDEIVNWMRSR